MVWIGKYVSDLGQEFSGVSFQPSFVVEGDGPVDSDPSGILAFTWKTALTEADRAPCSLPITPRADLLWVSGGAYWRVPNPFQPGSVQWVALRSEYSINLFIQKRGYEPERWKPYQVSLIL